MGRGAQKIRDTWRESWTGLKHAPELPAAITYDVWITPFRTIAEIGPDKRRRQGALGNLIEYGSVNNAPHPAGALALWLEVPEIEKHLALIAERLL
jgi:hypothetical protein